jgi:hypothetical protein
VPLFCYHAYLVKLTTCQEKDTNTWGKAVERRVIRISEHTANYEVKRENNDRRRNVNEQLTNDEQERKQIKERRQKKQRILCGMTTISISISIKHVKD